MADMIPQGTQDYSVDKGHEMGDVNVQTTSIAVLVVLSSVAVVMLAMAGMFGYLNKREMAKDKMTPVMYSIKQDPPGPHLLPSIQQDQLPWAAYQDERRTQEAHAASVGIIDPKTRTYQISDKMLSAMKVAGGTSGNALEEQKTYFGNKAKWETAEQKLTVDSTGGRNLETYTPDGETQISQKDGLIPGVSMTSPEEPVRNGEKVVRKRN